MTRRWPIVLAAFAGAALGALAVVPIGGVVVDGGPDCTSCGSWVQVLIGVKFVSGTNVAPYAALGALVGAIAFGTVAYALVRSRSRRADSRPST